MSSGDEKMLTIHCGCCGIPIGKKRNPRWWQRFNKWMGSYVCAADECQQIASH